MTAVCITVDHIQGGVGIVIPDRGPVGWFGRQAAKKKLEPQDIWLKNGVDGAMKLYNHTCRCIIHTGCKKASENPFRGSENSLILN
jgi:hypothetical protein